MVRKTLTMWMPNSVPPTPWKVRRFTSPPGNGGPGARTAGADGGGGGRGGGGGGGGGAGIRAGGGSIALGGGGAAGRIPDSGAGDGGKADGGGGGLRKKLGRPSGPGDPGPSMPALSMGGGRNVNLWKAAERSQHHVGGDGLARHTRGQGRQGVVHGIEHGAGGARGARLARALEAALGESGGRLHVAHHDVRHLGRHGHEIVGHG